MTKMQIIAKTVLTVLGIHVVLTLYYLYLLRYMGPVAKLPALLAEEPLMLLAQAMFCVSFTTLAAFLAYLMVFNNDSLARKMAGPGQEYRQTGPNGMADEIPSDRTCLRRADAAARVYAQGIFPQ